MSSSFGKAPVQLSPLAQKGQSLDARIVNCQGGLLSNIDDTLRPSNRAKRLRNFHQFTQGVFSSSGGGWKRDNATGLNSQANILDFGTYIDALGNQTILTQAGDSVYTYSLGTHTGTALAGLTGLSTTALPCIRPSSPYTTSANPFSIYCNGIVEPKKITGTVGIAPTTVATLGFDSGVRTQTITIGGGIVTGNNVGFLVFSSSLTISPQPLYYTVVDGDTTSTVATGLAAVINSKGLSGILATVNGNVITLSYPSTLSATFGSAVTYEKALIGGTITNGDTCNIIFTSTSITGSPVTVAYPVTTPDTTGTIASGLAANINANPALTAQGIAAVAFGNIITISYPSAITVTFTKSVTNAATETITLAAVSIETATMSGTFVAGNQDNIVFTSGSIAGSPVSNLYTVVTGDTASTTAIGLANIMNSTAALTNVGVTAFTNGPVIIITYPSTLAVTFTKVNTGATVVTLNATTSTSTTTVTIAAGTNNTTWPGVFNGLTYTKPALCTSFMNRTAYAQFGRGGTSGDQIAFNVLISSLGNAEQFTQSVPAAATDAWAAPIPAICGLPTAMTSFRPLTNIASEILVIGCQNGCVAITGTDATNFNLQIISTQFGIPSNRTFVQLDNQLLFMATDGFRIYTGQNNVANLLTDTISLGIYDLFKMVDRVNWAKSHAIHHRDTQEVWFWVPYVGPDGTASTGDLGKCGHAFIFNYNTVDGQPVWYTKDNTICQASIEFNSTFYGGNDAGLIQKWYGVSNYDDRTGAGSGQANIVPGGEIVLPLLGVGSIAQLCSINHAVVTTGKGSQKFLINGSTYEKMDNGATRKQQQQPIDYPLQSFQIPQTILGTVTPPEWTLNVSAFPDDYPKMLGDYAPKGHGYLWEFVLSCSDSSHNLDFVNLEAVISIGGMRI